MNVFDIEICLIEKRINNAYAKFFGSAYDQKEYGFAHFWQTVISNGLEELKKLRDDRFIAYCNGEV